MNVRCFGFLALAFCYVNVFSQNGGEHIFEILNMTPTAKVASVGGYSVSLNDADPGIAYFNPSMLDSTYKNMLTAGWGGLFMNYTDVSYGYASYANKYKQYNYAANLMIINYGKIPATDEKGNSLGNTMASEYVVQFGASEPINQYLRYGVSVKPIISYLADYSSYALAGDVGLTLHDSANNTTLSLVARNAGFQIKPYYKGNREKLPLEVDLGYTKRFAHAPFRFSVTYRHLQQFDMSYKSTLNDNDATFIKQTETDDSKFTTFTKHFARHLVFGAELLLSKKFYLAFGYNVKRKQELALSSKKGMVGLTYGFGLTISKCNISVGHQEYSLAGGTTTFTLKTNIADLMRPLITKRKEQQTSKVE